MAGTIEVFVPGGKTNPGPPLDSEPDPTPVDVQDVVNDINDRMVAFNGMEVPIAVEYDDDDSFNVEVGVLPMTALIKDEVGFDTGSGELQENFVADMSVEQPKRVAEQESSDLPSYGLRNASKEVVGTCASLSVAIGGEDAHMFRQRVGGSDSDDYFDNE